MEEETAQRLAAAIEDATCAMLTKAHLDRMPKDHWRGIADMHEHIMAIYNAYKKSCGYEKIK